ncbi:MAG: BON domain-containing protein [Pseudomonadota bacterium]|nr:BON domain-containing protein [Pseudomonadota bacterium]
MKQLRTVAAISAITLIAVAPTFAEQPRDAQGQTGVTGSQTTTEQAAAGQRTRTAEKDEHQALVARVEAALRADPALVNARNLVVLSAGSGEVTLSGSVNTKAQAARAVQVARNVAGVKGIEDKLVLESEAHVPATPHQSTTVDAEKAETE